MERRQLEYFLAVIDHGGFTSAATALHVSQPALSAAVKSLEKDLGALLFHRLPRGVRLTAAGVDPDRLYSDKLSGTSRREQRPGLAALPDYARAGDAIVVVGIARPGRNAAEVMTTIRALGERVGGTPSHKSHFIRVTC